MSLLIPAKKRLSKPTGSVGLDFNHLYLNGRILALNFNTNNVSNINVNYVRKYTGVLGSPVFPQTITKTGTDIVRVNGGIRLNATSTGNYYKTLTGVDSFSSSTATVTFLARFKVNRFISGGSSYNSIFCLDNVLNTFALSIDSGGNLYCNGSSTSLGAISFGQWVNVEIIQKPSGASVAYINNKRVDFTSLSNPASSSYAFWVASDANGNRSCDLTISHLIAISPGIYTHGQHNKNPWQIFEAESVPFYFDTGTSGSTTLTQSTRFDNSNSFYSATVTPGSVTLTASLFNNSSTIYLPTVTSGTLLQQASRFDNTSSFYAPTVTPGSVTLTASLFTNTSTLYAPIVTNGGTLLQQTSRFDNTSAFYGPTVTPGTVTLTQSTRFDNTNSFYDHTINDGAGSTLSPADLAAIANAVWGHSSAITAQNNLAAILAAVSG